jgi:hypothetical protein
MPFCRFVLCAALIRLAPSPCPDPVVRAPSEPSWSGRWSLGIGTGVKKEHEKTTDPHGDDPSVDELSPTARSDGAREHRPGKEQAAANRRDELPA